jgi:hypothetical protein
MKWAGRAGEGQTDTRIIRFAAICWGTAHNKTREKIQKTQYDNRRELAMAQGRTADCRHWCLLFTQQLRKQEGALWYDGKRVAQT